MFCTTSMFFGAMIRSSSLAKNARTVRETVADNIINNNSCSYYYHIIVVRVAEDGDNRRDKHMDPETNYRSITCRLRQHKRRRQRDATTGVGVFEATSGYNASFDVSQLVPERPVPDWIRHRVKASAPVGKSATLQLYEKKGGEARKRGSATNDGMTLDLKNMRKDWKSRSTRRVEALQAVRVLQNRRPEPVRDFPSDIRPLNIPSDSPVAVYAGTNAGNTRKNFGPPAADEETSAGLELGYNEIGKREMLMEKTYLVLDQSKLPLEVSYVPTLYEYSYEYRR